MGHEIHVRKTEKDGLRFRVWSTNTDSYLTGEMTESELRKQILEMDISNAIEQYFCKIDLHIKRAIANGTSCLGGIRNLIGPWAKERKQTRRDKNG